MTGTIGVFTVVAILIVAAGAKDDSFEIFMRSESDLTIKFQGNKNKCQMSKSLDQSHPLLVERACFYFAFSQSDIWRKDDLR